MKYSVIIPVYNAENTLKRCLDSLIPQLNSDIEVLLINDGSSDSSDTICKEYKNKSESIKYYEQENAGVSVARNKGIEKAIGNYILFVDSDDYVSDDYFESISNRLDCDEPDLLLFGARFISRSDNSIVCYGSNELYSEDEIAKQFLSFYKQNSVYTLWNKAFRKRVIDENNVRFNPNLHIGEDAVFIFHFFLYTKKMSICDAILYYVDESNQDSLSRKRRERLCNELIAATRDMEKNLVESSQKTNCFRIFNRCISWGHYRGAYACFNDIYKSNTENNTINDELRNVCELYRLDIVKPVGFDTILISIPVLWKMVHLIRLIYYIKHK